MKEKIAEIIQGIKDSAEIDIEETDVLAVCERCGADITEEDEIYHVHSGGFTEIWCQHCAYEHTVICEDCGDIHPIWEMYHSRCESCIENYVTCENCGETIHVDDSYYHDDEPYCYSCYEEITNRESEEINSYSFKPIPIFFGKDSERYFGVELETDNGSSRNDYVVDIHNRSEFYCKEDGSLSDYGVEIVSHPCTLKHHIESDMWKYAEKTAREYNFQSHHTNTCGLHIHVNRDSLGENCKKQEVLIAKLYLLLHANWKNFMVPFSRRNQVELDSWARAYCPDLPDYFDETYDLDLQWKQPSRYVALNVQPDETIEFRFFRGSLNPNTIYASIELIDCLISIAEKTSVQDCSYVSIKDYIMNSDYSYLKDYTERKVK